MSERISNNNAHKPWRTIAAVGTAAMLTVSGCSAASPEPSPTMQTCEVDMPSAGDYAENPPMTLHDTPTGIRERPFNPEDGRAEGANVMITRPKANNPEITEKGSGTIVRKFGAGEPAIVTAAHVTGGTTKLSQIKVTTAGGTVVPIEKGCYLFGEYQRPGEPSERLNPDANMDRSVGIDVAVLWPRQSLRNKLTEKAIATSILPPLRRSGVVLANNQGAHNPNEPAEYPGILVNGDGNSLRPAVLTGLTPSKPSEVGVRPGASGGGVINTSDGTLVGILTTAGPTDPTELKNIYGVQIENPQKPNRYTISSVVPAESVINDILSKQTN